MKLAALVSGGKDSVYAAYLASHTHEITHIVSVISENPESYMFHVPNVHLVEQQANAMGIPAVVKVTKGIKEDELKDLENVLAGIKDEVDGIVTGAVASVYQKSRIDNICKKLGLQSIAPLWAMDPEKLVSDIIADGFDVILIGIAAPPMDEEWLGRKLNKRTLTDLIGLNKINKISVNGEGGEYESLVLDCPLFRKKIEIIESHNQWDAKTRSGHMDITKVELVDK